MCTKHIRCIEHTESHRERLFFNRVSCLLSLSPAYCAYSSFPLNLRIFSVRFPTCFRMVFFTWYQSARVENLCSRHSLKGKPTKKNRKNRWIEAWLARFQQRSSTETTMCLGITRCTSTCSSTDIGAMSTEQMTQHPMRHTKISRYGNSRRAEYCTALRLVWANHS